MSDTVLATHFIQVVTSLFTHQQKDVTFNIHLLSNCNVTQLGNFQMVL